jgi:hypothetical protein
VLAVLTLAVHPFELPEQRPISAELLPPLTPPPMPTVEVRLKPRQADRTPPPAPRARLAIEPEDQTLPQTTEVKSPPAPQRQLLDQARPQTSELQPPVEVERRAASASRLQTKQAAPVIPEAPPEPVQVTRQAPALQPQVELPRAQSQGRPRSLDATRAAPQLPQAAAPEAAAPPSQVQALTNQQVIQAPVEIRPRERAPVAPRTTAQPGAADIPFADSGAPPPGGGPAGSSAGGGGGGQGGGGRPSVSDFNGINGINGGFGAKGGLRQTLGCEDPDTYKLTPEERAACLQRFGQRAKDAPDLGLPIPARKQAEYDKFQACQNAFRKKDGAIPNAYAKVDGAAVSGVDPGPSLKECGPSQR